MDDRLDNGCSSGIFYFKHFINTVGYLVFYVLIIMNETLWGVVDL